MIETIQDCHQINPDSSQYNAIYNKLIEMESFFRQRLFEIKLMNENISFKVPDYYQTFLLVCLFHTYMLKTFVFKLNICVQIKHLRSN